MGVVEDARAALRDAREDLAGETARLSLRVQMCEEDLAAAQLAAAPATVNAATPARGMDVVRQKVILAAEDLHRLLGLPPNVRVVEALREPERLDEPGDWFGLHVVFEGAAADMPRDLR